jgi:diguanylate cyclase (GGDEF)-like protein
MDEDKLLERRGPDLTGDAGAAQDLQVPQGPPQMLGRLGGLDLGLLWAVVRVAEAGSISGAAVGLGYSQPGLSQRIQAVERVLGCGLFRRGRDGVRVTPVGLVVVSYARALWAVAQAMVAEVDRATGGSLGGGSGAGPSGPCGCCGRGVVVPGDTNLAHCPTTGVTDRWEQAIVVATLREEVTRLRLEVARAWAVASTDELTGVGNRRALLARLDQALDAGRQVSLLLADLDAFKAINDTYGHGVGDRILQVVAQRLTVAAGPRCLVVRLGGDEFAIITGHVDPDGLARLVQALRATLAEPIATGQDRLRITASIGSTTTRPGDDDPGDLLARADAAMYQAKTTRLSS